MENLHERFTDEELLGIKAELITIRDNYQPVNPWDSPTADTFYITSTWNTEHQDKLLDGSEVEYILSWDPNAESGV